MNEHDCLPDRKPDFSYAGNFATDFYFEEMMMYSHYSGNPYPLKYDSVGGVLDFFDYDGDKFWIDCGEKATKMYQEYIFEKEFVEVVWK